MPFGEENALSRNLYFLMANINLAAIFLWELLVGWFDKMAAYTGAAWNK